MAPNSFEYMTRLPALALVLAFSLAGCSSDSTTANGSIVGTYSLRSIDGKSVPWTSVSGATTFTVTSATLTLGADLSYALSIPEQSSTGGVAGQTVTISQTGTYLRSGTSMLFTPTPGTAGATTTLTNTTITNGTVSLFVPNLGQCAFTQ